MQFFDLVANKIFGVTLAASGSNIKDTLSLRRRPSVSYKRLIDVTIRPYSLPQEDKVGSKTDEHENKYYEV